MSQNRTFLKSSDNKKFDNLYYVKFSFAGSLPENYIYLLRVRFCNKSVIFRAASDFQQDSRCPQNRTTAASMSSSP
jgi:hypothetical protein